MGFAETDRKAPKSASWVEVRWRCTGRRRPRGFDSNVARNRSSHRKLKPRGDRDEDCVFGLSGRSRRSRDQVRIARYEGQAFFPDLPTMDGRSNNVQRSGVVMSE
ncbi:hypothetical protein PspLS_08316 [Pyricularia sp. CBS 133598]|nr:hypothetical protein PspLS_08316 [Pyricularia sp. CBS 133598]